MNRVEVDKIVPRELVSERMCEQIGVIENAQDLQPGKC